MTLAEIEAFLAVYRTCNITKAAESQFISQSSFSLRLKTLERELGKELFVRGQGRRSLEPTQWGRMFYPLALEYISLIEKMHSLGEEEGSALRVSVINSLAECFFSPIFSSFLARFDRCSLSVQDMDFTKATSALLSGDTDLAFTADACLHGSLLCKPVYTEKMTLIASNQSALPSKVSLENLDPAKEIYVSWCSAVDSWHADVFGKNTRAKVSIAVIQQLKYFFESRDCWAIVPFSVAENMQKSSGVKILSSAFALPLRTIHCSRRLQGEENRYAEDLLNTVREHILSTRPRGITLCTETKT